MKKLFLLMCFVLVAGLTFTSCKEEKKEDAKEVTSEAVYQCPMDCEEGKTYTESGSCPVCKMDLRAVTSEGDHEHDQACKCMEGEECTCPEGECKCEENAAKQACNCLDGEVCVCPEGECKCSTEEKKEMATSCKMHGDGECNCAMKKA